MFNFNLLSVIRYWNLVYVTRFGSVLPWPSLSKNLFLRVLAYICCTTVYLLYSCTKYIFSHFSRPIKDTELEPKLCNSFPFTTRFGLALARPSLSKLLGHLSDYLLRNHMAKKSYLFTAFSLVRLFWNTKYATLSKIRQHVKLCNHVSNRIF